MELNLKPAFFWPINSTSVRSFKFSTKLFSQRAIFRLLSQVAPRQAVERAIRVMLTPPRQPFSDAELAVLEEASLLPVPLISGRLIGWRWGRAADPAVVLVHGWGGRGTQLRGFIEPLLERGFSVVAYDAPGHGMTGGAESSLPHFLQGLNAVLDHLGTVHAIVGHSLGGAVAAMAMAQRPAVKRAVLIAPPASLADSSRRIAAALQWPEALRATVQRRIEYRFGLNWSAFEAEQARGAQPLLVIHDRQDREVPFSEGRRHLNNWPRARLLETSGLGHRRVLEDATVIQATADFIAGDQP
ncbi:MAG: alpha/beta fold hydrolase [Sulfuritalea sp.]|jgi:pimeloyl-ACP methyl ester carboxylesterase|nr:alpha/beta fold hydrolase [Sulfuritalea sp.]